MSNQSKEWDIDALIQQGRQKHQELKQVAQENVSKIEQDTSFNFNLESIDMFMFQDKDFREEKKRVQQLLKEKQDQQKDLFKQSGIGRRQRTLNEQAKKEDLLEI